MDRNLAKSIRERAMMLNGVEKVRFRKGNVEVYGQYPNSNTFGWWFVAYIYDVEIKGLDIICCIE